ncbi:MAG TPA: WG repeat-containing protein, partial [Flavobacterium sp.]|nr:WG repeat-containing protein [Flavobacterium sp.]
NQMKKAILTSFLFLMLSCQGQTYENYERINKNNSWGFVDENGKEIIPFGIYEFLNPIDEKNMILAKKNGKDGYIDIHQNILIPFDYDDLGVFTNNGLTPAVKKGKSGAINRKGETVIPFIYDDLNYFYASGLAIVKKNGKFGFVDAVGKEVIPLIYEKVDQSMVDETVIVSKNKKWAFFSNKGEQLTKFQFDKVIEIPVSNEKLHYSTYFKGGLALVYLENKPQLINKNMQVIVPVDEYDYIGSLNKNGLGIVAKNNKFGIINNQGEEVIPLEYDKIEHPKRYSNILEIFVLEKNKNIQILDENIKPIKQNVLSYSWDKIDVDNYYLDVLLLKDNQNNFGILDETGRTIIPFEFEELRAFDGKETSIAKKNGKYGIINLQNQELVTFENDQISSSRFSEIFVVKQQNKFGLLDKQGKKVIDFVFEDLQPCYYDEDNKFIIKTNGKYGIIDISGNEIIPAEYDEISNWVEYGPEAHFVIKDKKTGMFSRDGKQLIPTIYDELNYLTDNLILVSQNKKYGIIDISNKSIIPLKYDKIYLDWYRIYYENQEPEIYVLKDKVYSQIDKNNKQIRTNIPESEIREKFEYYFEE